MKMVVWIFAVIISISNLYSFDLVDNSFIDFVRYVSNTTNKNFIIDENVNKNISIILPNRYDPKDSFRILKSILKKKDLYLVKIGDTYYIKKVKKIKGFYSYKMIFLLPDKVIPILKRFFPSVQISKSKKTIIFQCYNNESIQIKKLLSLLDSETKSRKIRITLISYKNDDLRKYGMNLSSKISSGANNIEYKTFLSNLVSSSSLVATFSNFSLSAYFTDLKQKNLINFKFSPVLSLYDGQKTRFTITQKIPFLNGSQSINGSNSVKQNTYNYKSVGTVIDISKVSITDDSVYFNINMKYEYITDKSTTPSTSQRTINNYLKIDNGVSLMITGLKSEDINNIHSEIPLLSSLPYLGNVFKWDNKQKTNETFAIIISNIDYFIPDNELQRKGLPPLGGKGSVAAH